MARQKTDWRETLSHAEIYNFAITYLGSKCAEGVEKIKAVDGQDKELLDAVKGLYAPWFFKAKKLCELYELETGLAYDGLAAGFGIEISDLDID